MPSEIWHDIKYPMGSNHIPLFIMGLITYTCWDLSHYMLVKRAPGIFYIDISYVDAFQKNGNNSNDRLRE